MNAWYMYSRYYFSFFSFFFFIFIIFFLFTFESHHHILLTMKGITTWTASIFLATASSLVAGYGEPNLKHEHAGDVFTQFHGKQCYIEGPAGNGSSTGTMEHIGGGKLPSGRYSNTTSHYDTNQQKNPQKIYTSPTLPTTTPIALLHQQSSTSPTSSASNSSTTVSSPTPSPKPATSSFCQIYSEEIPSPPTPSRTLPPTST